MTGGSPLLRLALLVVGRHPLNTALNDPCRNRHHGVERAMSGSCVWPPASRPNTAVPYTVEFGEPIGDRMPIDRACIDGARAATLL